LVVAVLTALMTGCYAFWSPSLIVLSLVAGWYGPYNMRKFMLASRDLEQPAPAVTAFVAFLAIFSLSGLLALILEPRSHGYPTFVAAVLPLGTYGWFARHLSRELARAA
jgi:hypothetical protein